jgi:hypothetical protein
MEATRSSETSLYNKSTQHITEGILNAEMLQKLYNTDLEIVSPLVLLSFSEIHSRAPKT